MGALRRIQIHQYNDPEILEFINAHRVRVALLGDHLFIIDTREGEIAAGPGDWLSLDENGHVDVQSGGYPRRARMAILSAKERRLTRMQARASAGMPDVASARGAR